MSGYGEHKFHIKMKKQVGEGRILPVPCNLASGIFI